MIRNRKAQLATFSALAVAAAVALAVSSAGAHTPATFTFPAGAQEVKSLTDGSAENAKQVLEIPGLGELTCTGVSYSGFPGGSPTTSIGLGPIFSGCQFLGVAYRIFMRDCRFVFNANGELAISAIAGGNCEKNTMWITDENPAHCEVFIGEQALPGVSYKNQTTGKIEEVTVSMALKGIDGEKGEHCKGAGAFTTGEYKQGNTILLGFEGATKKSMRWSATVP